MTNEVTLDLNDTVTALKEATKVQIAVNYARLVTPTQDEEGNDLPEDKVQELLNDAFDENAAEFEQTLIHTARRLVAARQAEKEANGSSEA